MSTRRPSGQRVSAVPVTRGSRRIGRAIGSRRLSGLDRGLQRLNGYKQGTLEEPAHGCEKAR